MFAFVLVRNYRAHTQNITSHLLYLFPPQTLTVEGLCGYLVGFVCVNTLTCRELSAFKQNTGVGMVVGAVVGAVVGRAQARAQAQVRACSQRQFVNIKQRQQHPNKFMRRLTGYCAIKSYILII